MSFILNVKDLHVSFHTNNGEVEAVRGVNFAVRKAETVAIVGESGCGKSVTSQAIMRLISMPPGEIKQGQILFDDRDLTKVSEREMQQIRGAEIAMIFQDPMTSLNPTITIGKQIAEVFIRHKNMSKKSANQKALEMLKLVGIPSAESRMKHYPHQLSGGMRQRVMIAIALSGNPKILIADEPTTALDVTIQAQIMDLMKELQQRFDTAIVLITHDLGVVAESADHVVVMYAGKVIETGTVDEIFADPRHPYTWGLLASMPRLNQKSDQELLPIFGTPPDLLDPPQACPFTARCPYAMKICTEEMPALTEPTPTHRVACWLDHPEAPEVRPPEIVEGGERL